MKHQVSQYKVLLLLVAGILAIFVMRTWLAFRSEPPRLFDLFDTITVLGSLLVLLQGYPSLRRNDWIMAIGLGGLVSVGMCFATLFSPYPFFGIVDGNLAQAAVRGTYTLVAALGGLTIMRQGGPIPFHAANGDWGKSVRSVLFGLAVGIPLAILNVFALRFTEGQPLSWQGPLAAFVDALQPGIVEEVIYRFAGWGLLWLILRKSLPDQGIWFSGLLATLIHAYAHLDDLFVQSPLVGVGMGLVLALLWGLPPMILARRKGMESAIAFHWLQDFARFVTGF